MTPQEMQDLASIASNAFDGYTRDKNVQKLLRNLAGPMMNYFDESDDLRVSADQEKDLLRQLGQAFGVKFPE
jgi:hypothetical protein